MLRLLGLHTNTVTSGDQSELFKATRAGGRSSSHRERESVWACGSQLRGTTKRSLQSSSFQVMDRTRFRNQTVAQEHPFDGSSVASRDAAVVARGSVHIKKNLVVLG